MVRLDSTPKVSSIMFLPEERVEPPTPRLWGIPMNTQRARGFEARRRRTRSGDHSLRQASPGSPRLASTHNVINRNELISGSKQGVHTRGGFPRRGFSPRSPELDHCDGLLGVRPAISSGRHAANVCDR
jgi:hypothetical protein